MTGLTNIFAEQATLGLALPERTSFDEWREIGLRLCMAGRRLNWAIGDWLIFGRDRFDDERAQTTAQDIFAADRPRFDRIRKVCERFPPETRRAALAFGHYQAVAEVKDETTAARLIDDAERQHATVRMLEAQVKEVRSTGQEALRLPDDDPEDKSYREIVQAWNRASRSARQAFLEAAEEAKLGVIDL